MSIIRNYIGDYRNKKEVVPVLKEVQSQIRRTNGIVYGRAGIIYALSNQDTMHVSYQFFNGKEQPIKDEVRLTLKPHICFEE